jgi:hypothetical protein
MITSCRCYGLPDLLRVPSPSSCGWVLTAKGSADTVLVRTLRFARRSFCHIPEFDVLLPMHTAVATELSHSSQDHYTCYNTSTNTSTYETTVYIILFTSRVFIHRTIETQIKFTRFCPKELREIILKRNSIPKKHTTD